MMPKDDAYVCTRLSSFEWCSDLLAGYEARFVRKKLIGANCSIPRPYARFTLHQPAKVQTDQFTVALSVYCTVVLNPVICLLVEL